MALKALPPRVLCLVTDIDRAGGEKRLLDCVAAAVSGGVNMVQVRAHGLDAPALTRLAASIVKAAAGRAIAIVNGPVSAALGAGADGVHFPETARIDVTAHERGLLSGKSAHSVDSAAHAASQDIDYLVIGTIFPSESHPGGATGGTALIKNVTGAVSTPVIGIGGITASNAAAVVAAGACGVAVIGAIIGQRDPASAARRLADAIGI